MIFLRDFKLSRNETETTYSIDILFGPDTAKRCVTQSWFNKNLKENENLGVQNLLNVHGKLQEKSASITYYHPAFDADWEGENAEQMGFLISRNKNKT